MNDQTTSKHRFVEKRSLGAHPKSDESLIGFVARLAERQRVQTVNTVFVEIGPGVANNRFYDEPAARLAHLAGTTVDAIRTISYGPVDSSVAVFRGRKLPAKMLDVFARRYRRLCPRCLEESAHHRCWWDVQAISVCPIHKVCLIAACPKCKKGFVWKGSGVLTSSCACELDLRGLACTAVTDDESAATGVMHGLLGDPRFQEEANQIKGLPPLSDLDDGHAAEFLFRLGLDLLGPRRKPFSASTTGDLLFRTHEAVKAACDVVKSWPHQLIEIQSAWAASDDPEVCKHAQKSAAAMQRWVNHLPPEQGLDLRDFI